MKKTGEEKTPVVVISIDAAYALSEEIARYSGERSKRGFSPLGSPARTFNCNSQHFSQNRK